jgi:hypothetical protein
VVLNPLAKAASVANGPSHQMPVTDCAGAWENPQADNKEVCKFVDYALNHPLAGCVSVCDELLSVGGPRRSGPYVCCM